MAETVSANMLMQLQLCLYCRLWKTWHMMLLSKRSRLQMLPSSKSMQQLRLWRNR